MLSSFLNKCIQAVYSIISSFFRVLGLRNVIILEMNRGTTQNTQAVFQEMLRRGWDAKYRFVLVSKAPQILEDWKSKRVSVLSRPKYREGLMAHFRLLGKKLRAVMIIEEDYQLRKSLPKTIQVFLTHGSPVKRTYGYYDRLASTDYALCQSEFWRPIVSFQSPIPADKRVILGQPRNDALFSSDVSMSELFGKEYKKVVIWYPTYRQHRDYSYALGTNSDALPIIHDVTAAKQINEIAAKYNVLLVAKPHPVQDLSRIRALDLSNLKLITDDFFIAHGISSYAFLGKTDALITDYSSVIFDYLLTGQPIALAQEDYEEYERTVGFAIDMDLLRSCAVNLARVEDFEPFFRDLIEGNDPHREKREELMHLTNQYVDGNSTKRVVDWMESLL